MTLEAESLHTLLNKIPAERYGTAQISVTEFGTLKGLYSSLKASIYGDKTLSGEERLELRTATIDSVLNDGWPKLTRLSTKDLAETATTHACVVVEHLTETKGNQATPGLIWSYATKNQFDRFVKRVLVKVEKLGKGTPLQKDWDTPANRRVPKDPSIIGYPDKVDHSKIHGIGKVQRYWPAQLMRYLEAIRLGKASKSDLEKFMVGDTNPELYKIPWNNFADDIQNAESTEDIAVGIAKKTLLILEERGLNNDQLIALLLAGYSPGGPISEHGNIPEIGNIWRRLISEIKDNINLKEMGEKLKKTVERRFSELKYPIEFN